MSLGFSKRAPLLLIVPLTLICAACSDGALVVPSASVRGSSAVIAVEPASLKPVFGSSARPVGSCPNPFSTQFTVVLHGGERSILGFGFDFVDRLGTSAVPFVLADHNKSVGPVSLPTSSPIPIPAPGADTLRRFPFHLQFPCGIRPPGTLFVSVNTVDRRHRSETLRLDVPVGN